MPGTAVQASFIFDTEDGTISAWAGGLTPGNEAVLAATTAGAVYKGLVFGVNEQGAFLFATNFHDAKIDVFDPPTGTSNGQYVPATTSGGFVDPKIPAGYAPFGIQNIDGNLFVTYAKQDSQKHDDAAGPGRGFVDVFDTDGHLLRRLRQRRTTEFALGGSACLICLWASSATKSWSAISVTVGSMYLTPTEGFSTHCATRRASRYRSTACGL